VHVAGEPPPVLPARIGKAGAVVQREVHRLRVQHLAAVAIVGHVAGGQHAGHVLFADLFGQDLDLAGKAIAARLRARKAGDDVIDPHIRHLLRRLHRGADRAFGFGHRVDLAKAHAARAGGGRPDHPERGLPGHRSKPVLAEAFRPVEAQHEAGDLRCAHIEDGDHPPLHRRAAHVPHRPLGLVKIRHRPAPLPLCVTRSACIS